MCLLHIWPLIVVQGWGESVQEEIALTHLMVYCGLQQEQMLP